MKFLLKNVLLQRMRLLTISLDKTIFLILLILLFSHNLQAENDNYWNSFSERLKTDLEKIKQFNEISNSENAEPQIFLQRIDQLINHLTSSLDSYQPLPTISDPQLSLSINKIIDGLSGYKNGLQELKQSINNQDQNLFNLASKNISNAQNKIKSGLELIDDINKRAKSEHEQAGHGYFWGTFFFALLSLTLFLMSIRESKYPTEQIKIKLFNSFFKTSLWPTGGFLFTLLTWEFSTSRNYTIATGAIGIGLYTLVRQLFTYYTKVRPKLIIYITAEKILIDHYEDLLKLFMTVSPNDFEHIIIKQFNISQEIANLIKIRLSEILSDYAAQEQKTGYDPYEVLGVNRSDSSQTIRSKYRELAKKYHPDISKSDTADKFKEINQAYTTILSEQESG